MEHLATTLVLGKLKKKKGGIKLARFKDAHLAAGTQKYDFVCVLPRNQLGFYKYRLPIASGEGFQVGFEAQDQSAASIAIYFACSEQAWDSKDTYGSVRTN